MRLRRFLDDFTGLYDLRARPYDAATGRLLGSDPVAVPVGMAATSGYAYGFSNPLVFSDPTGQWPDGDQEGAAAGLGMLMGLLDLAPRLSASPSTMVAASVLQTQQNAQSTMATYGPTEGSVRLLNPFMASFVDSYRQGGMVVAASRINPFYRLLENGGDAFDQAEKGCMFEAMRSSVHAGADGADVLMFAAGGAAGLRGFGTSGAGQSAKSWAANRWNDVRTEWRENPDRGSIGGGWQRMTTPQATAAAKKLGYTKTSYVSPNGEAIYFNGKAYASPDNTGHNGGVWKMAKTPSRFTDQLRMGTYDADLNRIGD